MTDDITWENVPNDARIIRTEEEIERGELHAMHWVNFPPGMNKWYWNTDGCDHLNGPFATLREARRDALGLPEHHTTAKELEHEEMTEEFELYGKTLPNLLHPTKAKDPQQKSLAKHLIGSKIVGLVLCPDDGEYGTMDDVATLMLKAPDGLVYPLEAWRDPEQNGPGSMVITYDHGGNVCHWHIGGR